MKKNWGILGLAAVFSISAVMTALAGQWWSDPARPENEGGVSNWWYQNDDSSYPAGGWEWIDGNQDGTAECYYFNQDGWMYVSTGTPDGFEVNENGAWTVNGVIQTKQTENTAGETGNTTGGTGNTGGGTGSQGSETGQKSGNDSVQTTGWFETSDGNWMYYTSKDRYVTGWKKISKNKYYFDEDGYMVTGYQELEDGNYYFDSEGRMATKTVRVDGVYYVIDEDGQIVDEVDEDDWTDYRRENNVSSSTDEIKNKTYVLEDGINEEMALDFLDLVNAERGKKKQDPLEINDSLMEAAQIRAQELAEKYSHTRPDGTSCYTVFEEVGVSDYTYEGENIAAGQRSSSEVVSDWMNSEGHKKNILSKNYTETGVACYIEAGTSYRVYWVQLFYTP